MYNAIKNIERFAFLALIALAFVGCDKDDNDYPPTIDRDLLMGHWEKIEIDLVQYCAEYLEFTNTSYRTKEICDGSALIGYFQEYQIERNNIYSNDLLVYEIEYLSESLLKLFDSNGNFFEYRKPMVNLNAGDEAVSN